MARIEPNGLFSVWSPDSAAECLEGIGVALYTKIWNEIVPLYDGKPRSEVLDDFSDRCLAKFWDKFTDDEKRRLNAAADREEESWDER